MTETRGMPGAEQIEKRRNDPEFQARLQRILDEEQAALNKLGQ